jgi:2-keto-4-pentenoate hydratase/2-oxohepta-3-ene-1,7-dioic acid hydratase in catechol pathway
MRLANGEIDHGETRAWLLRGDRAVLVADLLEEHADARSVDEILERPGALHALAECVEATSVDDQPSVPVAALRLRAPVLRPPRIFALAANFADHVREGGVEPEPKHGRTPLVFSKLPSTLIGPGDAIVLPHVSDTVDWEIELAAIVGTRGDRVTVDEAASVIAGFAVFNDLSARTMSYTERTEPNDATADWFDFLNGKWFDTSAALGPWLTTADEIADPHRLAMRLDVNGVRRQDSSTAEMIFSLDECVSFISQWTVLQPGDVIVTGTPAGCGFASDTFLKPGDRVRAEIEGLGGFENDVVGR